MCFLIKNSVMSIWLRLKFTSDAIKTDKLRLILYLSGERLMFLSSFVYTAITSIAVFFIRLNSYYYVN